MAKLLSHFHSIGWHFLCYILYVLFALYLLASIILLHSLCLISVHSILEVLFEFFFFSSFKISRLVILGFLVNILTLFEYKKDAWKLSSFNTNYDTKSSTENGH